MATTEPKNKMKIIKVTPEELKENPIYANDMAHYKPSTFIQGLLRKYFSRGNVLQGPDKTLQFWVDGVEKRSATLGYNMRSGEYAKNSDIVLFYTNYPSLVFDFRRRFDKEFSPPPPRSIGRVARKQRKVAPTDEWKCEGYPTILRDTEEFTIDYVPHHSFTYTISGDSIFGFGIDPEEIIVKYLLVFKAAFGKEGDFEGGLIPYLTRLFQQLDKEHWPIIVFAENYIYPDKRKVLGMARVEIEDVSQISKK